MSANEQPRGTPTAKTVYGLIRLLGYLPRWWHYFWSELLSLLVQYVVRYRRQVVRTNIARSFPELSPRERRRIERRFYRHFTDLFVEIIMLSSMSPRRIRKYLTLENGELFGELHDEGHPVIFMLLGHYGNPEWYLALQDYLPETCFQTLFHRQNGIWHYVITRIRTRFGAEVIDAQHAPRQLLQRRHDPTPRSYIFVADQRPTPEAVDTFVRFLGQDTPVVTGPERLARTMACPVVYVDSVRKRRGHYHVTIRLMTKDASQLPEGELTRDYTKRLEATIRRDPAYWLWSHKRWQLSRADIHSLFPDRKIRDL